MPALDFPSSPTNGQVYGQYTYDSAKGAWRVTANTAMSVIPSPTPPASPAANTLWLNTNDGVIFYYLNDGNSSQWVELKSNTASGSTVAARVDALEAKPSGLVPVIPTSVGAISSGTATVNSSGLVIFSGVNGIQLNGCFTSAYTNYRIMITATASAHNLNAFLRMRNAGVDTSSSIYYFGGSNGPSTGGTTGWSGNGANVLQWGNAAIEDTHGHIDIFRPKVTDRTGFSFQSFGYTSTYVAIQGAGMLYDFVSYDGASLYLSSGTLTGTIQVFGYR